MKQLFWLFLGLSAVSFGAVHMPVSFTETVVLLDKPGLVYDSHSSEPGLKKPLAYVFPHEATASPFVLISFKAEIYSNAGNYANFFQTADGDAGLRMELGPDNSISLISAYDSTPAIKGLKLSRSVWFNSPAELKVVSGKESLALYMDGKREIYERDARFLRRFSSFAAGSGCTPERTLDGSISDLRITQAHQSVWSIFAVFFGRQWRSLALLSLLFLALSYRDELCSWAATSVCMFRDGWNQIKLSLPGLCAFLEGLESFGKPVAAIAAVCVCVSFAYALMLDTHLSIYCDEIGYQMMTARAGFENFIYSSNPYPHDFFCKEPSLQMPLFWRPAQYFTWLFYKPVQDPRVFRLIGVFKAAFLAVWVSWLAFLALRERCRMTRCSVAVFVISVFSLGILPLIISYNRPEQMLVICLAWFILAPFFAIGEKRPFPEWVFAVLHIIALGVFFTLHSKTLLFGPLVLLSTFVIASRFVGAKVALACALLAGLLFAQSYKAYSYCFGCPGSERVAKMNAGLYLTPAGKKLSEMPDMFRGMIGNVLNYGAYPDQIGFRTFYVPSQFLPSLPETTVSRLGWLNTLIAGGFLLLPALSLLFLLVFFLSAPLKKTLLRDGGLWLLPPCLLVTIVGIITMQTAKPWYESVWLLPALAMLALISFSAVADRPALRTLFALSSGFLIITAACSLLAMQNVFAFKIWRGWVGPNLDVVGHNPRLLDAQMGAAEKLCGFGRDGHTTRLMLDDLTYMYFKETSQPYLTNYFLWAASNDLGDKLTDSKIHFSMLKNAGVSGIVQRCTFMDMFPLYSQNTRRVGDICCISRETIALLAGGDHQEACRGRQKNAKIK